MTDPDRIRTWLIDLVKAVDVLGISLDDLYEHVEIFELPVTRRQVEYHVWSLLDSGDIAFDRHMNLVHFTHCKDSRVGAS